MVVTPSGWGRASAAEESVVERLEELGSSSRLLEVPSLPVGAGGAGIAAARAASWRRPAHHASRRAESRARAACPRRRGRGGWGGA